VSGSPPETASNPASRLCLLGVNRSGAGAALRERLFAEAFDPGGLLARLGPGAGSGAGAGSEILAEVMVLATGERLEVAALADDPGAAIAAITEALAEETGTLAADIGAQSFHLFGVEAARHIFATAAALDSEGLGEPQILERIEEARRRAMDAGAAGPGLAALLQAAGTAAGRVRAETALAGQPVSIAASARLVARDVHGALDRRGALLVGLGEMGEFLAAELLEAGIGNLVVAHPSGARAEAAARRLGCHFRPWDELDDALASADIVVAAMGTGRYTVTAPQIEAALKRRRREAMFFIDAAVPGDVDPEVAPLDGAYLYDLEDLERVALGGGAGGGTAGGAGGQADRQGATAAAWRILDEELAAFLRGPVVGGDAKPLDARRRRFEAARAEVLAEGNPSAEDATQRLIERLLRDGENE
jgi:glutamyl-tRNA reductase